MSRYIVAGVDGSDTAAAAALTAARLAVALGAELVLVCAYQSLEVEQIEEDGREYVFTSDESALELAASVIRNLRLEVPELSATPRAGLGGPADVLLGVADDVDAALVVVGNKRVQGAARFLGSIATDVAHRARCDVYIAHTHKRD